MDVTGIAGLLYRDRDDFDSLHLHIPHFHPVWEAYPPVVVSRLLEVYDDYGSLARMKE